MSTDRSGPGPSGGNAPRSSRFAPEELRAFEILLRRRRDFLLGNVQKLEDEACRKGVEAAGDLSTLPLHLADLATDTQQQEMSFAFMESEQGQLQAIEDSLESLRDGTFGSCENCDREIAFDRLRAIPYARLCLECKRREEEGRAA